MEDENKCEHKKETNKTKEEIVLGSEDKKSKKEIEVIEVPSDVDLYCNIGRPMRWDNHHKEESV